MTDYREEQYFVLADQVVMTPLFVGSEPVIAEAGKYKKN